MDELYELCRKEIIIELKDYSAKGKVNIRNKKYVLEVLYKNNTFSAELCPVKKEASMFIESIGRWQMEKIISDYEMREAYESCIKRKDES